MQKVYYFASGSRDLELYFIPITGVRVGVDISWCEILDILMDEDDMDVSEYLHFVDSQFYNVMDKLGFDKQYILEAVDLDEY